MNPENFSSREITLMFQRLEEKLDRIEKQTTKTNGRVQDLERWRSYLTGGVAVTMALGLNNIIALLN